MCLVVPLDFPVEVFPPEDYSCDLGELRVVDFSGELQVILQLW
jgi:hypothetical protein